MRALGLSLNFVAAETHLAYKQKGIIAATLRKSLALAGLLRRADDIILLVSTKNTQSEFFLRAWGGAGTVTGSNFEISTARSYILIDCGLIQGTPEMEKLNRNPFPYAPQNFQALLVTHAHLDHIGRIPKLVREGFAGPIYSTAETKAIAEIILTDAAHLEREKSKENNVPPLFAESDVNRALSQWHAIPYWQETMVTQDITVFPYDAGHILGSAMYWVNLKGNNIHKSILMTGDLGNSPSLLLRDTEIPPGPDFVLMESVYGDHNHENRENREENFKRAVKERINKGGTVLIPAFSIERTQVILSLLNDMVDGGLLPRVPIFLDSPLGIQITRIYEKMFHLFNSQAGSEMKEKDGLFKFKTLQETAKVEDSHAIAGVSGPKIIIAGSGMSTGGRVVSHERRYLPEANASVLLMGYQAPGTLGRMLEEGAKKVEINKETIPVKAKIISIHGFSGHKDSDHLLEFVDKLTPRPKKVFLAMGEMKASNFLAQRIHDNLNIKTQVLSLGKSYGL